MDRESLLKMWDEWWTTGLWAAPWSKALDGLSPEQAAWAPAAGRNSIWQHVNHVSIWRECTLAKALPGRAGPTEGELRDQNFAGPPAGATAADWARAVQRLQQSHDDMRELIAAAPDLERAQYHLAHDSYHLGQILLLRALQGLAPIE